MFNFTKAQLNLIILEIVIIAAGITAILLREITYKSNVNILPPIRSTTQTISPKEYALPSVKKIDEIIKKAERSKEKEITIEIIEEPPKPKLKDVLRQREEKPEEFTIEIDDEVAPLPAKE